jgi:hypothetical protein
MFRQQQFARLINFGPGGHLTLTNDAWRDCSCHISAFSFHKPNLHSTHLKIRLFATSKSELTVGVLDNITLVQTKQTFATRMFSSRLVHY